MAGRAALQAFREHASTLVASLWQAERGEGAAFAESALLTLICAYAPAVSLAASVGAVQDALRNFSRSRSKVLRVDAQGRTFYEDAPDTAWPSGLMSAESVPRAMLQALANGSPWRWGECLRAPTPEAERELKAQLDPGAFNRIIGETVGDAAQVRWQGVVDALFAAGLLGASTKPSTDGKQRIAAALERLGFEQAMGRDEYGNRCRVWRRPVAAEAPAAPATAAPAEQTIGERVTNALKGRPTAVIRFPVE